MKMDMDDYLRYHMVLAQLDQRKRRGAFALVSDARAGDDRQETNHTGSSRVLGFNGSRRQARKGAVA